MIITKQVSICFNTLNQYVNANSSQIGLSFIQVPFPVKQIIIREIAGDMSSDSEYYALMNSDLLGGDSCLGLIFMGQSALIKDYTVVKNNIFTFDHPKIVNGVYNFFLRDSQLSPFRQLDVSFTGDVVINTDLLTVTAGSVPSVFNVNLGTGSPSVQITPPLSILFQVSATTYRLSRTVTPAYIAQVFTYPALTGAIQVIMEFSSV